MHWGQFSPALNYGKLQCMWAHMTSGKISHFSIFTKGKCPPLGACKETVKQSKAGRYLCKDRNDWLTERIKRDAGKIALWLASICGACDHARLTERDLNKMVAILQTTFSNVISWMKTVVFWLKMSLKFVPESGGPIVNKPALVQVTEPKLTPFDTYMRH